jgi:6-phosphogluconolactonase (cycloisomerase 2 family)
MRFRTSAAAIAAWLLAVAPLPIFAQPATLAAASTTHARGVYIATNASAGNTIVAFRSSGSGTLFPIATYATGGTGVGANSVPALTPAGADPLGSQGSLVITKNVLLVVNAGSASISSFVIASDATLSEVSTVASGGAFPTSIAVRGTLVYVANAGNPSKGVPATVSGFRLAPSGQLTTIANSTRTLSQPAASVAASIVFSPDGRFLVAADKAADRISTFVVRSDGRLGAIVSSPSAGDGPFGAIFHGGALLVAETEGGLPGGASVSSYWVRPDGYAVPISPAVASGETAECWLASSESSAQVYVPDTGTGTISSFVQGYDGTLRERVAVASPIIAGSLPIDVAVSADAKIVYQLYAGLGAVAAYATAADGTLTAVSSISTGIPTASAQGIAIY